MSASSSNVLSAQTLEYFFHHLFLPSKLPDGDDTSTANESALIEYVLETLSEFLRETDHSCHRAIRTAKSMMENMLAGRDDKGFLKESQLLDILRLMISPNTAASFHVKAQNAGILLRCDQDSAVFELFELSPTNGPVYAAQGRLVRHFPAIAIGVPRDTYTDGLFQQVLAKTLAKMSYEAFEESIPKARKAKQDHDEERETNDPSIVIELLGSFLRGIGHQLTVSGIRKNTREGVLWNQSKLPWRRSPIWLLIRGSLHLTMNRIFVDSQELYKSFMIFLLSRVLNTATNLQTASETLKIMSTKVSRRLLKLRHPTAGTWLIRVHKSVSAASDLLDKRWQSICDMAEPRLDLEALSTLDMTKDVYIRLPELNLFISSISKRDIVSKTSSFCPTSDIMVFNGELPTFPSSINKTSLPFILAMVESWVAEHLDDWLDNQIHLMQQYNQGTCQRMEWQEYGLQEAAARMSIEVHEWPLSSDPLEAQATVFELALPKGFGAWRDATIHIIDDLLHSKPLSDEESQTPNPLRSYSCLSNFFRSNAGLRVHLLSSAKPHILTHRRDRSIATSSEEDVCVNNGLRFRYFDDHRQVFLDRFTTTNRLPEHCTFKLTTYSAQLSRFLILAHGKPAGETPNAVIASQALCPEHMTLSEFRALATLRFGYHIQWLSVLTQLAMPDVDFNKAETAIFFLQLSLQVGPNKIPEFGRVMLERLQGCVSRIRENWESNNALWILIFLATRLLSMTTRDLTEQALSLLSECREVAFGWLEKLRSRAHETKDDDQRIQFLRIALRNLIVVISDPLQSSMLLEASINIYNKIGLLRKEQDLLDNIMHDRWMFTLHRARRILVEEVLHKAFRRDVDWYLVSSTCNWFETISGHQKVHFNILNGSLLVNGSPLSCLPREYETHQDYEKVTTRGMSFCGCKTFDSYAVHFGMQKDTLRDGKGSLPTLDLVPSRLFNESLPHSFVRDYIHWYNHTTNSIEFFPIEDQCRKSKNWILTQHDGLWKLTHHGRISLLAPNSQTATLLAAVFSPLDQVLNLHMLFNVESNFLKIKVSSLQLEFVLKCGGSVIQSRQFRGMKIDANQSMKTLVGFESKLVLRDSKEPEIRMVIIPEGEISFSRNYSTGHVRANVKYGTAHRVQSYLIDSQLRRLVDNATVQSKLFLAYIHALNSYCIPDPFFNRTETEEALAILESASIRLIDHLTEDSIKFYPDYLRTMQKVTWIPGLSFLTQDSRFYKIVNRILHRVSAMSFLYPPDTANTRDSAIFSQVDNILIEREIFRNSRYQVSKFGAEDFSSNHDLEYVSRDRRMPSSRVRLASETAFKWALVNLIYKQLSHEDGTPATSDVPCLLEMEYGVKWLEDPQTFLFEYWCRVHYAFQTSKDWMNKFQVMIWLTTLAYSSKCDTQILQALIMLSLSRRLSEVPLPEPAVYKLAEGYTFDRNRIHNIVTTSGRGFHGTCPEMRMPPYSWESETATLERRKNAFLDNKKCAINAFVSDLFEQWPCCMPSHPSSSHQTYIDVPSAMCVVETRWRICDLSVVYQDLATRPPGFISVSDLFSKPPPFIKEKVPSDLTSLLSIPATGNQAGSILKKILEDLELQAKFGFERQYLSELRRSLSDLRSCQEMKLDKSIMSKRAMAFEIHLIECNMRVQEIYDALLEAVLPSQILPQNTFDKREIADNIALMAGFWPRFSPTFFLQQLGRHGLPSLTESWKKAIVAYGVAITGFQQAQRLVQLIDNDADLLREVQNTGHKSWDPCQYPEWLLLECESGIIIRDVQHQVAEQMIIPENSENAVMQLNMGEGKSSVIVPIVATALSNGSQIVRVIVAKPQAKQMHQMLVSKLSGLLDRPIFRMPFSRAIRIDQDKATKVQELAIRCMREGGVMMVQPEQLLSFQLMGLEYQINGNDAVGRLLLGAQQLFENSSRDIVDESDENFNVKFELIYTIGLQRHAEHTPDRWVVIQEVLDRFAATCLKLKSSFPKSLDINDRYPERFPRIRILRADAELAVLSDLARSICSTGMAGFSIARQPEHIREAVYRYITQLDLTPKEISRVEESAYWEDVTINYILLLRGLFSGGILAFVFGQKRWRVDYGTDFNREMKTQLAVPFRAKDNPKQQSEFSHPDVVIALTCLSYYYSGLNNDQLFDTLDLLIRSDSADLEYDVWVKTAPRLPCAYKHLTGINIRDRAQCINNIFPVLRYSKGPIDYFLSHMVFAKELREFPHKLSASGWDLGKKKANPTTGFSGTNDSRYVLPLAMKQLNIPAQNHTNALVLEYLLRPENGIMLMSAGSTEVTLGSESLIEMVSEMGQNARVILDFAKRWLESFEDKASVQAVVFFSATDELTVVDKSGKIEPLQISPFAKQLDQCLVFLDEAHTRGTDLRLPAYYQAAVTLGANLTKDKLVQACMRMRKLGKGQSVIFCIPKEIEQKILMQRSSELSSENITVSDVLRWSISETWLDLRRSVPLWLAQGVRFYEQDAMWKQSKHCDSSHEKTEWAKKFLEDEAQSLDLRYRPRAVLESTQLIQRAGLEMKREFESRCEEFGLKDLRGSSLQEEQERELSPETEREQQVEPPPQVEPQTHFCHEDLVCFIEHGKFPENFTTFKPAFQALRGTSAAHTVRMDSSLDNITDLFQRPVQWILTKSNANNVIDHLVIISPWEAHQLLEKIEKHKMVTLHIYSPRSNLGFESLDRLTLYTVPQRQEKPILPQAMMIELNLFAGQLYLSSFQEYVELCDILGLAWSMPNDKIILGPDGFIPPGIVGDKIANKSGFKKSPVQFLKVLITKIRRSCEAIEKTHIGKILDGILLLQANFEADDRGF
ncbi:hypothetical protein V8C42DRAFT_356457 [Trichoderma barbatum]